MKKIVILIVFLKVAVSALCQDTVMVYYDANWQVTTAKKSSYYRKQVKNNEGWDVADYFKSGKIQMKGTFTDDSCTIRQGEFTWYQENGAPSHIAQYNAGKTDGQEIYYYPNGKKKQEGLNKMDNHDGDWIGYYESGSIAGKAHFEDGKQVSGSFYREDGSVNKLINEFDRAASFPGGTFALNRYINSQIKYPEEAAKNFIDGQVVVSFIVQLDGRVTDAKIVHSVDELLDKEALRVIRMMPRWNPGIEGAKFVKCYEVQPIIFSL